MSQDVLDELNLLVFETGQVDVRLLVERSTCTERVLLPRLGLRGRSSRHRRRRGRRLDLHLRRSLFSVLLLDLLRLGLTLGPTRRRCPLALLSGGGGRRDLLLGRSSSIFAGGRRRRRRRRGRNLLVGLLDQDADEKGARVLQMRVQPQAVFEAKFLLVADRPQSLAPRLARAAAAAPVVAGVVVRSVTALPRELALVLALAALVVVLLDGDHLLGRRRFRRIFGGGFGCVGVRSRVQVVVEHLPRRHARSSDQARQLVGNGEDRHFYRQRVTT